MRKFRPVLIAVIAFLAGACTQTRNPDRYTESSELPLFSAFKAFCIDTGAQPDAVKAAVKAAGGKPHYPPGDSTKLGDFPDAPFPLTLASWDVIVHGHNLSVNAGTAYPSRKFKSTKNPVFDFDSCDIHSWVNEDASVAAIRDWVGIPPGWVSTSTHSDKWVPDLTQYHYEFQLMRSKPAAITSQIERVTAEAEGRQWGLVLMRSPSNAALSLTHELVPNQAN